MNNEELELIRQRKDGFPIPGSIQYKVDIALSNLIWQMVSLTMAGRLELNEFVKSLPI